MNLLTKTTVCALLGTLCLLFFHPTAEARNINLRVAIDFTPRTVHATSVATLSLPENFSIRELTRALLDHMKNVLHIADANINNYIVVFKRQPLRAYDFRIFEGVYPGVTHYNTIAVHIAKTAGARAINTPPVRATRRTTSEKE